jgi:hypothetical protein
MKYSGKFTDESKPLTYIALFAHRKHVKRSLPAGILGISDMGSSAGEPMGITTPAQSAGFDSYLGTVAQEKEMIETLVDSAFEDLTSSDEMLHRAKGDIKDEALIVTVRNQLRKALGDFITLNKELTSPTLALNIGDTNKKLFIEFLLIIKKVAETTIVNEEAKNAFFNELTIQFRKSREFKSILQEESERRDIMDNVSKVETE